MKSNSKKVLIVGANGNIGKACINHFSQGIDWRIYSLTRDVLKLNNWTAAYRWACKTLEYDLVIMAQGTQIKCELGDLDFRVWEKLIDDNLTSAVILTSALKRYNKMKPGGLLVYCSSIQATHPRQGRGVYAIAKAGLETLAKIGAVEWSENKVRTVALRLGQMTLAMKGINFEKEQLDQAKERCFSEWPSPTDVATFIDSLYYQHAITGTVIDMDSGHNINVW